MFEALISFSIGNNNSDPARIIGQVVSGVLDENHNDTYGR